MGFVKYRPYFKRISLANSGGGINFWEIFCEDKEQNIFEKMLLCKEQFDGLIKDSALNLKSKYVKKRRLGERQRKDADNYLKAFKILHKRLKQHRSGDL